MGKTGPGPGPMDEDAGKEDMWRPGAADLPRNGQTVCTVLDWTGLATPDIIQKNINNHLAWPAGRGALSSDHESMTRPCHDSLSEC